MDRQDIIDQLFDNQSAMKRGMQSYMQNIAHKLPVSRAQVELLFALRQLQPAHSKQLAEYLGLTPGAVSQLTDSLFTKDFVGRTTDADDRRSQTLKLSKKGEKLIASLEKQRQEVMKRVMSELKTDELAVWLQVQQKMIDQFKMEHDRQKGKT